MYTQQLGHIVHQLLQQHRMVILPGFGGLVSERSAAQLDVQRGRLTPPSDTLLFNGRLRHNDGLLTSKVAEYWDFSHNEADRWVTDAITEMRFTISHGGTVEWPHVGTLSQSVEGHVRFVAEPGGMPSPDLIGLRPLQLTEVQRKDNLTERTVATVKELPARRIATYTVAAMAAGLMIWLPFQQGVMQDGKQLVAEMGLMPVQGTAAYVPRTFNPLWEEEVPVEDVLTTSSVIEAEEAESTVSYPTRFHVVAAVFSDRTGADAHVATLRARGFMAEYAGVNGEGQHLAAYGTYGSLEDAEAMLASVSLSNRVASVVPAKD